MIYYHYELRWKEFKSLETVGWDERSDFEIQYSNMKLRNINEDFYNDFLKNGNFLICVTDMTDCELEIYSAVSVAAVENPALESILLCSFADCDIVKKNEVTLDEYKREIEKDRFESHARKVFDKLEINYREGFMNQFPFDFTEEIMEKKKFSKIEAQKRAKEILGSTSLTEELSRIYSKENLKIYMGHPVHYFISAGDWGAAKDIYELLILSLLNNKRLLSGRVEIIRDITRQAYRDERYRQMIKAANGGVMIIELKSEDDLGRFATDFHELTKYTGSLLEEIKKDTLFIFVEITGKSIKDYDALNNILKKADFIQLNEGTGTVKEAERYLLELAGKTDFYNENNSDVMDFLPEADSYTVTEIFKAYNAWYGSGLKNHVYKAYRSQKTFHVEITKAESKPYDELQSMVGLDTVKTLVDQIIAAAKVLRLRERMGLDSEVMSLHMVFSGNPGTAKTTVARLLAKILKEEDAIKSGRFVECGRQDLVGKYVGWTAHIVEEKFKEASGGILFIDEAYSLIDDSNTYGAEAINTITQLMENYRNEVIVIFAGYPDKMKDFIDQNEGLRSRISFHLDFPDYSPQELVEIIALMAKQREYEIDDEGLAVCLKIFRQAVGEKNYGNGRYVRNIMEQAILRQSQRIISESEKYRPSKKDICLLKACDFKKASSFNKGNPHIMGFAG